MFIKLCLYDSWEELNLASETSTLRTKKLKTDYYFIIIIYIH